MSEPYSVVRARLELMESLARQLADLDYYDRGVVEHRAAEIVGEFTDDAGTVGTPLYERPVRYPAHLIRNGAIYEGE